MEKFTQEQIKGLYDAYDIITEAKHFLKIANDGFRYTIQELLRNGTDPQVISLLESLNYDFVTDDELKILGMEVLKEKRKNK